MPSRNRAFLVYSSGVLCEEGQELLVTAGGPCDWGQHVPMCREALCCYAFSNAGNDLLVNLLIPDNTT